MFIFLRKLKKPTTLEKKALASAPPSLAATPAGAAGSAPACPPATAGEAR